MKNPQAFPRPMSRDHEREDHVYAIRHQDGMTLRDYFAAAALPSVIYAAIEKTKSGVLGRPGASVEDYAEEAYIVADAMLAEREK